MKPVAGAWNARLTKGNAFDLVRLILAATVIFEHSFFLVDGDMAREPIFVLTNGQANSGALAVYFFLAVSGFLVTHSCVTSSLPKYLAKRVLRVVPGFLVASLVALLVIGLLTGSPGVFAIQNWPRLAGTVLALKQINPPGMLPDNPFHLIHGTLWTIRYEFDCYLALAAMGVLGLLKGRKAVVAFLIVAVVLTALAVWPPRPIDHGLPFFLISSPDYWGLLFPFFFAGAAFYIWRDRIPRSPIIVAASVIWIIAAAKLGGLHPALVFGGTYLVLYAAMSFSFEPRIFGRRTDLSYGLYLYGWPVQQLVIHYLHPAPIVVFAIALPLAAMVAWASWALIEAPALRLAHAGRTRTRSGQTTAPGAPA